MSSYRSTDQSTTAPQHQSPQNLKSSELTCSLLSLPLICDLTGDYSLDHCNPWRLSCPLTLTTFWRSLLTSKSQNASSYQVLLCCSLITSSHWTSKYSMPGTVPGTLEIFFSFLQVYLCTKLYPVAAGLTIFGILVAEIILSIRVWALWERRKDVGILLILMGVMGLSVTVVLYILNVSSYTFIPMDSLSPTVPGCFLGHIGATVNWPFVPLLVQQTIIFTLTAVKASQHYLIGIYGTSLVNTFYRDGLVYYIVLIVPSITILSIRTEYSGILLGIQRVLHSILSARMLLHLRQEVGHSQSTLQTLTDIRFLAVEGSDDSSMHGVDPALVTQIREESHDSWFGET